MKIALQARSSAVSPIVKATPGQPQASGTDFKNALNSTGAYVEEREGKTRSARDGRSGEESNKRKNIQTTSTISDAKSVVSAAPLAVAPDAVQAIFNLSSALQSPAVLTTDGGKLNVQGASGETTDLAALMTGSMSFVGEGGQVSNVASSGETVAPAVMPGPMPLSEDGVEGKGAASPLNATVPEKATSQVVETSGSSIQSKAPSHQVAEAPFVNQANAESNKKTIVSGTTQPNDQVQPAIHAAPVAPVSSGVKDVAAQSKEAIKPPTESTHENLEVQTSDAAAAVVQSVATGQSTVLPPVGLNELASKLDLRSGSAGGSIKVERAGLGSTQGTKAPTNVQTGTAVKGKDGLSDGSEKRADGLAGNLDSSAPTPASSFVTKVSETTTTAVHGLNIADGGTNSAAAQMTPQTNQPASSNHEQTADQQVNVASSSTDGQRSSGSTTTNLQDATGISSAQVIQSMHRSEMRVGMQSAEFGDISISTSINHRAMSAQISIDHTELSKALAFHLPAMEAKLGSAYGMPVRVDVRDGGSASSFNSPGQQSKEQRPLQPGTNGSQTGSVIPVSVLNESTTALAVSSSSRLDIRI